MFSDVELGPAAVSYIRAVLREGATLSRFLAELPLDDGRVSVLLPRIVDEKSLYNFDQGGVASPAEMQPRIAEFVLEFVSLHDDHCAILEDTMGQPTYPYVKSSRVPYVTYNDEVYYVLTSAQGDPNLVLQAIRRAASYRFVAALAVAAEAVALTQGREVTSDMLRRVAVSTRFLLVGAYDGETALVWSRT